MKRLREKQEVHGNSSSQRNQMDNDLISSLKEQRDRAQLELETCRELFGKYKSKNSNNDVLKNKHEIERLQVALNHNQNKCNELTKNNITTLKSNKQLEIIIRKEKEEFSKIKMEYQATEEKNKAIIKTHETYVLQSKNEIRHYQNLLSRIGIDVTPPPPLVIVEVEEMVG